MTVRVYAEPGGLEGVCRALTAVLRDVLADLNSGFIPASAKGGTKITAAYQAWRAVSPNCAAEMGTKPIDWLATADYSWLTNDCGKFGFKYPSEPIPTADDLVFRMNFTLACAISNPYSQINSGITHATQGAFRSLGLHVVIGPRWFNTGCEVLAGWLEEAGNGDPTNLRSFGNNVSQWAQDTKFIPSRHYTNEASRCQDDLNVLAETSGPANRLKDIMTSAFLLSGCNMSHYDNTSFPTPLQRAEVYYKVTNASDVGYTVRCTTSKKIIETCGLGDFSGLACRAEAPRYRIILATGAWQWQQTRHADITTQGIDFKTCWYMHAAWNSWKWYGNRQLARQFIKPIDRILGPGCPTSVYGIGNVADSASLDTLETNYLNIMLATWGNGLAGTYCHDQWGVGDPSTWRLS